MIIRILLPLPKSDLQKQVAFFFIELQMKKDTTWVVSFFAFIGRGSGSLIVAMIHAVLQKGQEVFQDWVVVFRQPDHTEGQRLYIL